jgi:hypothetical protein
MKHEISVDVRSNKRSTFATGALFGLGLLFATSAATAGVIFQDDFRSGDLSKKLNGANFWSNNSASYIQPSASGRSTITVKPETTPGDYSVRALYAGTSNLAEDARPELRFNLGGQYSELWISYRLYIPTNYYHRQPSVGTPNNKAFIIDDNTGRHYIDFEVWPLSDGADHFSLNWKANGVAKGHTFYRNWTYGAPADRGRWHNYVIHLKMATSANNNGVVQVWKNGAQVLDITNLANYTPGYNFFERGYIFGASNSGFTKDTELRLDDVTFATTPPLGAPRWIP